MNKLILKSKSIVLDKNLFLQVYLLVCLLYFMPSSLNVTAIPKIICFVWSLIILANELLFDRSFLKSKYWYLLIAISVSFIFTSIFNINSGIFSIFQNFVYMLTFFFIAYTASLNASNETIKKNMYKFNNIFIVVVMIAALISLIHFFLLISYYVPIGDGRFARQGFMESRLFGVYSSPNVGSLFGFISIVLVVINHFLMKAENINKIWKSIYILNIVVQLIFYFLSSSRGTQLVMSTFLLLLIFFCLISNKMSVDFIQLYSLKKRKLILVLFLSLLTINLGTAPIKNILGSVPGTVSNFTGLKVGYNYTDKSEVSIIKDGEIKLEHSAEGAEVSSGRFKIWSSAIEVWKQKPILGYGNIAFYKSGKVSGVDEKRMSETAKKELKRVTGNMHNDYIQILLMTGIVGFSLIILFYILSFSTILISFFSTQASNDSFGFIHILMFTLLVSFFVGDLVESHLLFNNRDVVGLVFWYFLGILSMRSVKKVG